MENRDQTILFFDGICGLCNYWVNFLLPITKPSFQFSPIQGKKAQEVLDQNQIANLSTVILYESGNKYYKAEAILKILSSCRFPFNLLSGFKIFPLSFLNFIYDFIASIRYKIFGKKETCRIPNQEERSRFPN